MSAKKIEAYLSGGISNTDPNASLGGAVSTTKFFSQTVAYETTLLAGVTLLDGAVLPSVIDIHFDFSTTEIYITESPQLTAEIRVNVSVDGEYVLLMPLSDSTLTISVVNASLPAADETHTITAIPIIQNLFDNVTSAQSQVGDINYRHLYFTNILLTELIFAVSIYNQLNGMDYIELGIENSSSGATDTLLANENIAPPGVIFIAPTKASDAVALTVSPGSSVGVFFKRTVLALTDVSTPTDSLAIALTELV